MHIGPFGPLQLKDRQETSVLRPIQKATEQCLRQVTALSMNDCQRTQGVFRKGNVLSQDHRRKNMSTEMQGES